jgi:hypothetical protein
MENDMATYCIEYRTVVVYKTFVVADSEDEAKDILMSGECDVGDIDDSWFDDINYIDLVEE